MDKTGIGIIGCGNISAAYLRYSPLFRNLDVRLVADINQSAAEARAAEFGKTAVSVDDLLGARDIDIIVNLTIPDVHYEVTRAIIEAGKHAYSEKPFVLSVDEGKRLRDLAEGAGLRIGSAPDTFLGGAHQLARALIDEGGIGTITSGTAHMMSHGMEYWHPNPDFFYKAGGGPMLDVGPYYVANLIQLLGPVSRVAALANTATPTRTILTEGPRKGETIPVETPTNIHALLAFASGASIALSTSWDVWAHRHGNMELYGTEGALFVPDPNMFGGKVEQAGRSGEITEVPTRDHPFGVVNLDHPILGQIANYRTAGLADMAAAIAEGRPHRCSLDLALHAVDVMTGFLRSPQTGGFVAMSTTCDRPAALSPDEARSFMA